MDEKMIDFEERRVVFEGVVWYVTLEKTSGYETDAARFKVQRRGSDEEDTHWTPHPAVTMPRDLISKAFPELFDA